MYLYVYITYVYIRYYLFTIYILCGYDVFLYDLFIEVSPIVFIRDHAYVCIYIYIYTHTPATTKKKLTSPPTPSRFNVDRLLPPPPRRLRRVPTAGCHIYIYIYHIYCILMKPMRKTWPPPCWVGIVCPLAHNFKPVGGGFFCVLFSRKRQSEMHGRQPHRLSTKRGPHRRFSNS